MGCSNGRPVSAHGNGSAIPVATDPRLPFTQQQIKEIKSIWNLVKRKFEETARENLIIFFHMNPIFQNMFPHLSDLKSEQDMRQSPVFMMQALAIFSVYDDVIENLNQDLDGAIAKLEEVGRLHAKIDAFHTDFFQFMEEPMIHSLKEKFYEDFHEHEEELYRSLFRWMQAVMTVGTEPIS